MSQIKRSFDTITLIKIGKGALISGTGAFTIGVLMSIGSADLKSVCTEQSAWICNQFLLPFVAFIVPVLTNAVKEWMKGE